MGDEVKREFIDIDTDLTEEEKNETELLLEEKHQKEITDNLEKIDNEIKEGRLRFNFAEDNPERISKIKSIIDFNVNRKKSCYIISYKSVDLENTIPISTSPFSGNFYDWGYGEINKVKIILFKNKNENEDKIIKEITFYGSNGGRYSIDTIEYEWSSFYKNLICYNAMNTKYGDTEKSNIIKLNESQLILYTRDQDDDGEAIESWYYFEKE